MAYPRKRRSFKKAPVYTGVRPDSAEIRRYNSMADFIERLKTPSTIVKGMSVTMQPSEFNGNVTTSEAIDYAVNGWAEGTKQVKEQSDLILNKCLATMVRHDIVYDVEGISLDVARWVEDEPEQWMRYEPVEDHFGSAVKMVHVVFNCSASANVDASVINAKGAAVTALVNALEYAGIRVKVSMGYAVETRTSSAIREVYITLKEYSQPLDLPRLTFTLVHPAMLRRLMILEMEHWSVEECTAFGIREDGGYGIPHDATEHGDIYIGRSHGYEEQWASLDSSVAWVKEQLKAQGVHFTAE